MVVALAAPAFGQTGSKKPTNFTKTERAPFAAGGTIRIDHTYGELSVEGWDRAEVELTVTKIPNDLYDTTRTRPCGEAGHGVSVGFERTSDTEIDVSTAVAHFALDESFRPEGARGNGVPAASAAALNLVIVTGTAK